MITRNAEPFFKVIYISSGKLDYIETIRIWRKMLRKFDLKKYSLYLNVLFRLAKNKIQTFNTCIQDQPDKSLL